MTPADYLRLIVLPTLAEMVADPADQRRAYLACITAAHLVDHVSRGGRVKPKTIREEVASASPYAACCLEIIEGVSNGTKHAGPSREADFPFTPGQERTFLALPDGVRNIWGEGRWSASGIAVDHDMRYWFLDDCVRVTVRTLVAAYPKQFEGVSISEVAPELDRYADMSGFHYPPLEGET